MHDIVYACNRCSQATPVKGKDKKSVYLMFNFPFQSRPAAGISFAWSDNLKTPHLEGHALLAHGMGGDGETYL